MLELVFTIASLAVNFATSIAVPATYVGIPYLSGDAAYYVSLLVAYGTLVFGAYVALNVLDTVTPQTSWALYRLSFVSSWLTAISINITAAIVFYQLFAGGYLRQLADITGSMQLLLALTAFSWFDVFYLQRRKYANLAGPGAAGASPPPLVMSPARTDNWGWALVIILLILGIGAVVMFATGVKVPEGLLALRDKASVTAPPAPKAEVPLPARKPSGKGRVLQSLQEWAKLTDDCLAEEEALSTSHAVPGCFAAEDGTVACTHDRFEQVADTCRTKANAAGRPQRVAR